MIKLDADRKALKAVNAILYHNATPAFDAKIFHPPVYAV
jgi:hypothetical protein